MFSFKSDKKYQALAPAPLENYIPPTPPSVIAINNSTSKHSSNDGHSNSEPMMFYHFMVDY